MSAIDRVFARLAARQQRALVPFVTAGDPDLEFTLELVHRLAAAGCALCELGIPYSDPIADGPVIQASYTRALATGVRLEDIWSTVSRIRAAPADLEHPLPLVAMVSYAIVHRRGPWEFVQRAQVAGCAGLVVPDLPWDESRELQQACRRADVSLIQLVTPTTSRDRALRIAEAATGFLYYVSVAGVTGERRALPQRLVDDVHWLRQRVPLPVCVGFGIGDPQQVRQLAGVADGLIVGSAIVRRVAEVPVVGRQGVLDEVAKFAQSLLEALAAGSPKASASGHGAKS